MLFDLLLWWWPGAGTPGGGEDPPPPTTATVVGEVHWFLAPKLDPRVMFVPEITP